MPSSAHPPRLTLFPYTTLFRSQAGLVGGQLARRVVQVAPHVEVEEAAVRVARSDVAAAPLDRRKSHVQAGVAAARQERQLHRPGRDRKSTRLNSSHSQISYAVFCPPPSSHTLPLHDPLPISSWSRRRSACPTGCTGRSARRGGRSGSAGGAQRCCGGTTRSTEESRPGRCSCRAAGAAATPAWTRSEEHTSELQSQSNIVCRLLPTPLVSHSSPTRPSSDLKLVSSAVSLPDGLYRSLRTSRWKKRQCGWRAAMLRRHHSIDGRVTSRPV